MCGRTDLRYGIERLANIIAPYDKEKVFLPDTLYLFCRRKNDRSKGLVWEKGGLLLLYKRLENGSFQWPRNEKEVKELTPKQFRWLIEGFSITPKRKVEEILPSYLV